MTSTKRFENALPGDVQVRAASGTSVWISDRTGTNAIQLNEAETRFLSASISNVTLNGIDLRTRIDNITATSGVGLYNVNEEHISAASVNTDKLGGVLAPVVGGSGKTELTDGAVAVVRDAELTVVPELSVSGSENGLVIDGGFRIVGAGSIQAGQLLPEGESTGRAIQDLRKGAAPQVTSASHVGATLSWSASDRDGDLRGVRVVYSNAAQTPSTVVTSPGDWFDVDEGGYYQIFVGTPDYTFCRDAGGLFPLARENGVLPLHAGRSYRFEVRSGVTSPFWVGTDKDTVFNGFDVSGTAGRGFSTGLVAGEYLQFTVPEGFAGAVFSYCTTDNSARQQFEVRSATPPFTRDPITTLSGSFDTTGVTASSAHLVAVDSAGNTSSVYQVSLV